jgi:hypothetical protein
MAEMYKALPAVLVVALATIAPASPVAVAANVPAPSATRTPPPTIYHIITRPLCSELHKHIAPAVGMMLQNDQQIGKSPDLFKRYNQASFYGVDNTASNNAGAQSGITMSGDAANGTMTPSQNMALLGMENLVGPIANNIIAIQKLLGSPELTNGTGNKEDDARLAQIRAKLLKALATQQASLDIISGFVDTQQLADIQHAGQEYIASVEQKDITLGKGVTGTPTPLPGTYNPNAAGLGPNPYAIDLSNVPGLTLGYNPVTRLIDGLHWTIDETQKRESEAAKTVMDSASLCSNAPSSPKPH